MEVRSNTLDRLKSRNTTIDDFNFDNLWAPPLLSFLTVEDINYLHKLATSIRYTSKTEFKFAEIDRVMKNRGFVKLAAGTNRICYRYLENTSICIKVAYNNVGTTDSIREFKNQEIFKPFVCKIFEVSPCGTVALVERVEQIKNKEEYISIAGDIFDMLYKWFIGKYVLEDIGTDAMFNIGLRTNPAFGPVLLDYPYVYELDGAKLYCSLQLDNGQLCNGEIDYDDGLNYLICKKCGARYRAQELERAIKDNTVIEKGRNRKVGSDMKVVAKIGNSVVKTIDPENATKKITRRELRYATRPEYGSHMVVKVNRPSSDVINKLDEAKEEIIKNEETEIDKVELSTVYGQMNEIVEDTTVIETPVEEEVVEEKVCDCETPCEECKCKEEEAVVENEEEETEKTEVVSEVEVEPEVIPNFEIDPAEAAAYSLPVPMTVETVEDETSIVDDVEEEMTMEEAMDKFEFDTDSKFIPSDKPTKKSKTVKGTKNNGKSKKYDPDFYNK